MIEGNLLTQQQVSQLIGQKQHFPGREREEKEVLGYYTALEKLEELAAKRTPVSEILHLGGCGLKGLYSLEEYYARNLGAYFQALTIGPSHNYYQGRAEAAITPWINYFCEGMTISFESVGLRAQQAADVGASDRSDALRKLDPRQRTALELFKDSDFIVSHQLEPLFGISQRTARNLLAACVRSGSVIIADPAKRTSRYALKDHSAYLAKVKIYLLGPFHDRISGCRNFGNGSLRYGVTGGLL
jgi:Fic family protein